MKRRQFLQTVAIGGGGAMLTANELSRFLSQDAGAQSGSLPAHPTEQWRLGICGMCSCNCGLVARIVNGRVVNLRGSPFHPLNRGGLCPRGIAGTQLLYHPERLLSPMKRVGKRGEDRFEPTTWRDALALIGPRVRDTAGLLVVAAPTKSQLGNLRRAALPGARFVEHRAYHEAAAPDPALFMTQGVWGQPAYDLKNSDFVFSFDSRLLERPWHFGETLSAFGAARGAGKCRLVHAEARRSVTGSKADEWVPIHPGTEATLALGIAHLIIKESLADNHFLETRTAGYTDWTDDQGRSHEGFRSRVLKHFDPRTVADVTSVPIDKLIRLARSFAGARRSLALGCPLPGVQDPHTRMAIHCLNALVGSIERPGGVLTADPLAINPFATGATEPVNRRGTEAQALLAGPQGPDAEAVLADSKRAGAQTVIFADADVVGESVAQSAIEQTIDRSDFVVAIATLPNATSARADLILPKATYLEQFMDVSDFTGSGYPLLSLSAPVCKPQGDSRAEGDIWIELAQREGRKLPFANYEQLVQAAATKVYGLKKGQLFGLEHQEAWSQVLESSGWRPPVAADAASFWTGALKVGGWWDPVYYHEEWQRALRTPSGRFEFHSQSLAKLSVNGRALQPSDLEPHQPRQTKRSDQYPLALQLFTPATIGGVAGRLSWLRSLAGGHVDVEWDTWVEVNPQTAHQLKLKAGARAQVRSERATIKVVVVHSAAAPPQTAAIPCGMLPTDTDPKPAANPLALVAPEVDPLTGQQIRRSTWVTIEPIGKDS